MQVSTSPSAISERALVLALRLKIAEVNDDQHVGVDAAAIPDRVEVAPDSRDAWVYGAYAVVMSRTPDDEGLAGFRQSLEFGKPPAFVLQELRKTHEGRDRRANLPADTRDVFVIGCHLLTVGRSPSSSELVAGREALDHQSEERYLAVLAGSREAGRALRTPPLPPDRNRAIAVAIQRIAGQTETEATTSRLAAGLDAGQPLVAALVSQSGSRSRRLLARIKVRLNLRSTVAQVEAVAANILAQQENAITRDLIWRLQLDQWRSDSDPEAPAPGQAWAQWFR